MVTRTPKFKYENDPYSYDNYKKDVIDTQLRLYKIIQGYTVTIPQEMFDFLQVLQQAANSGKYVEDNWLQIDGKGMNRLHNGTSMQNHLNQYRQGASSDPDSGLDPLLHLAARALMAYTRKKKGLNHPLDEGSLSL